MDDIEAKDALFFVVSIMLIGGVLIELSMLLIASLYADRVECTLLWCTFTSERSQSISMIECYENGQPVNCTRIKDEMLAITKEGKQCYQNKAWGCT
jgi:hypothetical protein